MDGLAARRPHPLNLLLAEDGNLVGVIDWGDICSGDPASDLADAWLVFDEPGREQFMAACGPYDSAVWQRAQAWALGLACTFAASSDDQPDLAAISSHTLTQLGL